MAIWHKALRVTNHFILFCQNYKKVVEDLVQVVSSQEKELAEKSALVADLQQQLQNNGSFLLSLDKFKYLYAIQSILC
jgi:hypothetical protein